MDNKLGIIDVILSTAQSVMMYIAALRVTRRGECGNRQMQLPSVDEQLLVAEECRYRKNHPYNKILNSSVI